MQNVQLIQSSDRHFLHQLSNLCLGTDHHKNCRAKPDVSRALWSKQLASHKDPHLAMADNKNTAIWWINNLAQLKLRQNNPETLAGVWEHCLPPCRGDPSRINWTTLALYFWTMNQRVLQIFSALHTFLTNWRWIKRIIFALIQTRNRAQ